MSTNKEHIVDRLTSVAKDYQQDFEALTDPQLGTSPMAEARTPFDITYEVTFVNHRLAKRLRGEDPGPFPEGGWMTAPEDFKSREMAMAKFNESVQDLLTSWENVTEEEAVAELELPFGKTSLFALASHAANHMTYHDGQLNYIQELGGDMKMHWG